MIRLLSLLLLFHGFFTLEAFTQKDSLVSRIILIGDAGELHDGKNAVIEKAKELFGTTADSRTTVIYLGDNVYEYGLPDNSASDFLEKKAILDAHVSLVEGSRAHAYFVMGNHDWQKSKPGGWQRVLNQQRYIDSLNKTNLHVLPSNGCPGPVDVVLNDKVVVVFMDSQWWLQQADKPGINSGCEYETETEVINALKELVAIHEDKLMVVAMHHAFYTHGPHGGYYKLKQHIFPFTEKNKNLFIPLPLLGSVYPIARGLFGIPQDIHHPGYRNLIENTEEVLRLHPNIIHVAGHEHSLQLLEKDSISYIVSGSGAKNTRVKKGKHSLFAASETGFAVLDIMSDGRVKVNFYSDQNETPLFSKELKRIKAEQVQDLAGSSGYKPEKDSASDAGSDKFKSNGLRNLLIGKNYRNEWREPVTAPVLNMATTYGGLTPVKRGGGHQTKSLRLEDASGKEWVLRGIEKNITDAALPPDLRGTFVKDIVQDGVSASYPYAALSVPALAEAAGVPHAGPRLVYVPDDPRLGRFKHDFANTLCLLEEREPGGFEKTINTTELAEKLADDNDNRLDQHTLLKARLLDMFIMDFDRHEDQWRWGVDDKGKGNRYMPLPRDRDQAFFINQGLLSWVASWPWITPQVQGFRSKARNINFYNFNARNIDRAYLNQMEEQDWKEATEDFLSVMADELIEKALAAQPREIKKYSYGNIISKLKERRKYFTREMMRYYRFISKTVTIPGSDKNELFDVRRDKDGSVTVTVNKVTREGELSNKIYERKFDPAVTKELRLYGLGNDDKFNIHGPGNGMKIRIIGGKGEDTVENNSQGGKTIVYDLDNGKNVFRGPLKMKLSGNPDVNRFAGPEYNYNLWIPFVSFAYNRDDGLFLGASLKHIAHGFRKTPYARSHMLAVNHALATKAFNFRFNNEFIKAIGSMDLLFNADIRAPNNVTNFFGYGNGTVNAVKTKPGEIDYYRTRYRLGDLSMLLRKAGKTVSISFGPAFQFYGMDTLDNAGRIIDFPSESGLIKTDIAKNKSWMGGLFNLGIDTRNNKVIPIRGINWQSGFRVMKGINGMAGNLTQFSTDMSIFMSLSSDPKAVLATRFGYAVNTGSFEFFQAQYLGGTENLRGYRKFRFAGKSMAFNNTELRVRIADFRTYLFPGSLGFVIFHDAGRVWHEKNDTNTWHTGYGGGIWIAPMRRTVLVISLAKSDEETLPVISLGFQF